MKVDYNDISKTYDKYRSYPRSLIENIVDFGEIKEGAKVLDLGCGTGNVASQLRQLANVSTIGVDISTPMLKLARGKSLEVICADLDNSQLPFRDSSLNIVVAAYVIHQITNLRLLLSECYRILRDGALVLLTSSHSQIEHAHPVIKEYFPSYIDIDKGRFPDIPELENLIRSAGFRGIEHRQLLVEKIPMDQEYLLKVRGKYVSTYRLLPEKEFELGVRKLETFIRNRRRPAFVEWRGTLVLGMKQRKPEAR
jgi:ubiquinone/menaquinone biosynthesis C-methylase UbiE